MVKILKALITIISFTLVYDIVHIGVTHSVYMALWAISITITSVALMFSLWVHQKMKNAVYTCLYCENEAQEGSAMCAECEETPIYRKTKERAAKK